MYAVHGDNDKGKNLDLIKNAKVQGFPTIKAVDCDGKISSEYKEILLDSIPSGNAAF